MMASWSVESTGLLPINDLGEITGGYLVNACNGEKVGIGDIGLAMIAL